METFWRWYFARSGLSQVVSACAFVGAMMIGPASGSLLGLPAGGAIGAAGGVVVYLWYRRKKEPEEAAISDGEDWSATRASSPENRRLASFLFALPVVGMPIGYIAWLLASGDPNHATMGLPAGFLGGGLVWLSIWKLLRFDAPLPPGDGDGIDPVHRPDIR